MENTSTKGGDLYLAGDIDIKVSGSNVVVDALDKVRDNAGNDQNNSPVDLLALPTGIPPLTSSRNFSFLHLREQSHKKIERRKLAAWILAKLFRVSIHFYITGVDDMARIFDAKILSNEEVAEKIFRLTVDAPELAEIARAGQFVQVKISDEFTLRRPLGIASTFGGRVKIFYRVVGRGTETLSTKRAGERLNILGALGNGYTPRDGKILLVGGGMGLAPLLCAAEKFSSDVLMGGRNQGEVFFLAGRIPTARR